MNGRRRMHRLALGRHRLLAHYHSFKVQQPLTMAVHLLLQAVDAHEHLSVTLIQRDLHLLSQRLHELGQLHRAVQNLRIQLVSIVFWEWGYSFIMYVVSKGTAYYKIVPVSVRRDSIFILLPSYTMSD